MKKILYSLLFIVAALFIIDRVGGELMWLVNQHSNDTTAPKIRYLHDGVMEDMVLMGTSRCHGHYVSSIIRDSLGMSVYNGGIDASENIYSHYILLCHMLENHSPKVICLDVRGSEFLTEAEPFKAISFFAPYYGCNSRADSVFRLAGTAWKYEVSHLYRYNSKAPSNILGLIYNKQNLQGVDNGYHPIAKPSKPYIIRNENETWRDKVVDKQKIEYLLKFSNMCKQKGIKLIFVVSPMPTYVSTDFYKPIREFTIEHDIPFMDYHTSGLYLDHPEYFKDSQHLWDEGARLFSQVFAHDIKNELSKNNNN